MRLLAASRGTLRVFSLVSLLALVYALYAGSAAELIGAAMLGYLFHVVGVVGYHRITAHEQFVPSRWLLVLTTLVATLWGAGSTLMFKAMHTQHHAHSDTPRDPHSPLFKSRLWLAFMHRSAYQVERGYLIKAFRNASPWQRWLHDHYWSVHLCYAALLAAVSPALVVYAYLVPAFIASTFTNAFSALFAHSTWLGYQNFPGRDMSRNWPLGAHLTLGEYYHNNHHRYPGRVNYAVSPGEFDVGYWLLKKLGEKV